MAGACENNVEMVRVGPWGSRVRKLSSRGRMRATIWEQTIALSEDGQRYEVVADTTEPQTSEERKRLRALRDLGNTGVTAPEFAPVIDASDDTARRALEAFAQRGWARREGGRPVRYFAVDMAEPLPLGDDAVADFDALRAELGDA